MHSTRENWGRIHQVEACLTYLSRLAFKMRLSAKPVFWWKRVSFLYSFAHGFAWRFHALPFFFSSDEFLTEILSVKRIILVLDQIFRRSLCSHPKVSSNEKWAEFGECAVTLIRRHCQLKINLYCSVYVRFRADLSFNWLASVGWYGGKYDSETKHNLVQYMELCAHLTANFSADKSNQKASLSCVKK